MAIVFSYPPIGKNDVQPSDRLLLSQMTVDGNPTRSVTVNTLRQYLGAIVPTNIVTGTGTTNTVTKWTDGPNGVVGDSGMTDDGTAVVIPYKLRIDNATSGVNGISFEHPAGGASGVVQMYYAGAAAGSRFTISRAATGGAEIELQSNGDVNINRLGNGNFLVGGEVTLDDYGSGAITGTPTFFLAVDTNGKIIEEVSAGGGNVVGSGTIGTLPVFVSTGVPGPSETIASSNISQNGSRIDITGELTVSQLPIDFAGSTYLFEATGAEFSAEIDMQGNQIVDLAGPVLGTDAVNKNYVDTEITAAKTALGYSSVQVFQWPNGTPVAYTNWTNGTPSNLPFNATPLVETGTYIGTAANFAWTCANQAGGTATQQAQFTLGANGAGTWQIDTCQHWFDQTNQVEIRVSFQFTSGGVTQQIDVIDEKSTELSGDKIFYGSLVREFVATDKIEVEVEFVSGGVNPFPSDSGNRPIEITFTKLV